MRTTILASATFAALSIMLVPPAASAAGGAGRPMPSLRTNSGAPHMAQPSSLGPTHTGQPNQSCGSTTAPNTPGRAAQAPGSAFNPSGHAGTVYAGEQPQNSRNTASVSQYDAACLHQR